MIAREICICIATHRRPQQLKRLLTSLIEQQEAPPFEVAVVDNDAGAPPRRLPPNFGITYLVEPVRGLARARNRSVAASTSKFLAFIDDDHWATTAGSRPITRSRRRRMLQPGGPMSCSTKCLISSAHAAILARGRRDALPHPTASFSTNFDLTGGARQ